LFNLLIISVLIVFCQLISPSHIAIWQAVAK